ncbi:formate dehydrogenase subunit gamma [Ramlibacter sp. MMS24-I3-19]|uniref:formate dehydrogenase subunit gamma n=1 Tax=Ramlibacter sp. MMS24-I3-19 TaxID=3416606 RepID=UPI003D037F37
MSRSTDSSRWLAAVTLALACCTGAFAQDKAAAPQPGAPVTNAPTAAPTPAPGAGGAPQGIQGQNIFTVKPDADADPNYLKQNNGERNRVQPGNNAPMWRQVSSGTQGYTSLPKSEAPEAGVLVQRFVTYPGSQHTNAGEAWRQVRNQWLIPYGGALLLIVLGALAIFYFAKGPIGEHEAGDGGRRIERFTPFERSAHWANAIAFCTLAISGMVMAFGRALLLPVIGGTLFGWLTYGLKTLHNFVGPLFLVSLVIVFVTFLRDNFPQKGDLRWLLTLGGMLSKDHRELPSHRFNAGEKVVFWGGVFLLGIVVTASGLVMDKLLPGIDYVRQTMQVAHMVHNVATVLMIAMFLGHIYIGTIGMRGAYSAMREGWVGDAWAREHHAYWYDEIAAGRIPAERSTPAGRPVHGGPARTA